MNTNDINTKIYASSPESLISFMEHSNDHWFIKDKLSRYIYMNDSALNYFNYPKGFDVEGKLDKEMPMESNELWSELVAHDQKTMKKNKTITSLEVHYYGPGNIDTPTPHICDKTPLYDKENNCLGVVCRGTVLDAPGLLFYMNRFNRKTIQIDASNDLFTKRELEIIFWAQQRLSAKEIAKRLDISTKTVEVHLTNIYSKADVHSIIQLIEYCKHTGLDRYIPSDFIRKGVQIVA